jgi:hypothetical protein
VSAARLGALDGLQRGILNLKANWELIPLVWVQTILGAALSLAALLPFYLTLDIEAPAADMTPDEVGAWLIGLGAELESRLDSPALWLAVASSSAVLLALLACYSFFQAGALGILATGDRQAPHGRPTPAAWFRTYSWAEFQGRGGMHLWRFFWLFNLVLLFWLGWALLGALALATSALVASGAGLPAGLAVGCAAFFPLAFLLVVLFFWAVFGQALVADTGCGAWAGLRRALGLVVRRLGAVTLLFVLMVVASVTLGMFFVALSLPLSSGLLPVGGVETAATLALQLFQWLAGSVVQLALVAAVVAIVRAETSLERNRVGSLS